MDGLDIEKIVAECIKRIEAQDGVEISYELRRKENNEVSDAS